MTEKYIIDSWFESKKNRTSIETIAYEEPVYSFIKNTSHLRRYGSDNFYNICGSWYKIVLKNKNK